MSDKNPHTRRSISKKLSRKYINFIENGANQIPNFDRRVKIIRTSVVSLLRKQPGSANAAREIPRISKELFGIMEDAKRLNVKDVEFQVEIELLNNVLISVLEKRVATKYGGKCGYGESLLNAYIDIFITATLPKTSRIFEAKPSFLVNPSTGNVLELDVMLEDFRLAFEFQGEHHYVRPAVQAKDAFKLAQCAAFSRVLVPVNISQLVGMTLGSLIINAIAAFCGVQALIRAGTTERFSSEGIKNKSIFSFMKAVQRIFLANSLYQPTISWLDAKSSLYIAAMSARHPVSSTTAAPRQISFAFDISLQEAYAALPRISQYRKRLAKGGNGQALG